MSGKIANLYGVDQYMTGIFGKNEDLIKKKRKVLLKEEKRE